MTTDKKYSPRPRSGKTAQPDSSQIREQARQKVRASPFPDLESMTHEEIRQMVYEMQVKQIETELYNEQLWAGLDQYGDRDELLATITENVLGMVVLSDFEGNIKFAGDVHEILGYESDFLRGKNVMDFVDPEHLDYVKEEFDKLQASGEPRTVEYRFKRKDGSYMWLETVGKMVNDEYNSFQKILFSAKDITERKCAEQQLQESEKKAKEKERRYRLLFEQSPLGVFHVDENGVIVSCNENFVKIIGSSQEALVGLDMKMLPDQTLVMELCKALSGTKGFYKDTYHSVTANKSTPVKVYFSPLINESGTVEGCTGIVEDITEQNRSEEALRQSENYYRAIFETSGSAMFIIEEDTTISHVNSNFEAIVGYSKEMVEGKKFWTELVHPEDVAWMKKNHSLRRRDPRAAPLNSEFRFFARNGDLRHGHLTVDMIPGTAQSVVSLLDITERKQAEQQLMESEERFSKAFWSSPAPQVISEIATGTFIDVNDRWVDMLGYTRETLIGRTSKEVGIWADPGDRDRIILKLQKNAFFNEEPVEFRTSTGGTVNVLWSAEAITLNGRYVMLSMIYDETERKQAEQEREQLRAQLAQAQKMESVGRLAGGVAHDFNNMLSIINGYAEISLENIEPSNALYSYIREIHDAGMRSAAIVRQLLAFARQQTVSPVRLDLNNTISSLIKMLQRLIGENIDLAWHPGNNLWPVKIDPSQIDQIIANLAINARDALSDVGRLTIETKNIVADEAYCKIHPYFAPGKYVLLAVSDNGCGMDKETLENLFEPFFTTKGVGEGTGLGLPTVYGIVKQNRGFINVYSEPGKGTTFKIYLPHHEEPDPTVSAHLNDAAEQMPTGAETILLVEDESAILEMGKSMLKRLGYKVLTAETPGAALQLSEKYEGKIHLLITDVIMPEMNGRDLASRLSARTPGLKVLYMSGYTANVIAHHGVLEEGVQFIQKPFSLQDLSVKVRATIEQEKGEQR